MTFLKIWQNIHLMTKKVHHICKFWEYNSQIVTVLGKVSVSKYQENVLIILWFYSGNITTFVSKYYDFLLSESPVFSPSVFLFPPSSALTLSNMWLLQERKGSDLPSVAPQICNISLLHFSSSELPLIHNHGDIFLQKHVELLKDLRHISLHYLKNLLVFGFVLVFLVWSPWLWHRYCMQCFFKKMDEFTLCPEAFDKSLYWVI